jgi:hypothetical protein
VRDTTSEEPESGPDPFDGLRLTEVFPPLTGPDPFEEGTLAASLHKPLSSNPYLLESEENELWIEGHDHVTSSNHDGDPIEDDAHPALDFKTSS